MKYKIIITTLLPLLLSALAYAQPAGSNAVQLVKEGSQASEAPNVNAVMAAPFPNFSIPLNFTLPAGYPNKGVDGHNTVEGTAYVYTKDPSGIIKNPIIVPEAFDAENKRGWDSLYNRLNEQNTLECLRNLGYDFIVLDYKDGGNFIEHNAYLLAQLIKHINTIKTTAQQNIIVGPSLGGLVARYALTYMEKNNESHDTRLFISFDAPQYGANVPLGIQYVLRYWNGRVGGENASDLYEKVLKSNAAKQLLIYHIVHTLNTGINSSDPLRVSFEQNLNALGGWPKKLRKVAISNGSGFGQVQLKNDNVTPLLPGDKIFDFDEGPAIFSRAWAVPNISPLTHVARCKSFFDGDPDDYDVSGTWPLDNMPCGYRWFTGELKGVTNLANASRQSFIPTFSALALSITQPYYNVAADPGALSKTPFDAIYFPSKNQEHVDITAENKNWLLNEIVPYERMNIYEPIFTNKGFTTLEAYKEIRFLPGVWVSGSPGLRAFINPNSPRCNVPAIYAEETNVTALTVQQAAQAYKQQMALNVFPNPTNGMFKIVLNKQQLRAVEVISVNGTMIYQHKNPGSNIVPVDLSEAAKGIYILKATTENEVITEKIIIQ